MPRMESQLTSKQRYGLGLALTACLVAGVWWLNRPPVQLSEQHYAVMLALYRICNQRSLDGLQKVEATIALPDSPSNESVASLKAIQAIISDARQEHWAEATQSCRQLLDQQVQR